MSAIFGIINKSGNHVDREEVDVMLTSLLHRANNGNGVWIDGNVALGHCLLKVFPQQNFEKQPQKFSDLTITADVRLDNREELAKILSIEKHELAITSDPSLILLAFQRWGKECVKHLEGEFAFAIWDKQNQSLFAATDPIGYRPFYYYSSPNKFIFSSEMKGVVAAKPLPNYFNEESLIEYFYRKGSPENTYNKEIFALCGGNSLVLEGDKLVLAKYWTLESTGKYNFRKDEDWYDCTRDILYRSIEKRLNPDVPIGITLSGGLDSTSIASILSELLLKKNKPLYAISSVLPTDYKGIESDERHYIDIVGRYCPNLIQIYEEGRGLGPLTNLNESFDLDETFPNPFSFMDKAILRAAAEKNIRILYTGFGGDYWISNKGNTVVYDMLNDGNFKEAFSLLSKFSKKENKTILQEIRVRYLSHTKAYKELRSFFRGEKINWQNKTFLNKHFLDEYSTLLNKNVDNRTAISIKKQLETGRIGRIISLLHNRNSGFAMESATPMFDKELMEFLMDVPERLFVEKGTPRNLIRSAMHQLIPQEIAQRTDKLPYTVGFPNRLISQKELALNILNSAGRLEKFEKYLNIKEMFDHFNEVVPYKGFGQANKIIDIRIAQSLIVYYLLERILQKGYSI